MTKSEIERLSNTSNKLIEQVQADTLKAVCEWLCSEDVSKVWDAFRREGVTPRPSYIAKLISKNKKRILGHE